MQVERPAASEASVLELLSSISCWKVKAVDSNLRSCSMKPSFGSVLSLCVLTNSKASFSFMEKRRMMNMITLVAERDIPMAQWTKHFVLKSGFSLLIDLKSF